MARGFGVVACLESFFVYQLFVMRELELTALVPSTTAS
jgi:hypothetical protein